MINDPGTPPIVSFAVPLGLCTTLALGSRFEAAAWLVYGVVVVVEVAQVPSCTNVDSFQ
tara:strand:+ start:809 stop:985 length:177 start_codon:yes stop_codon:yes gene_type:complete